MYMKEGRGGEGRGGGTGGPGLGACIGARQFSARLCMRVIIADLFDQIFGKVGILHSLSSQNTSTITPITTYCSL